jgi:histidyl-tRNA synthetase
MPGNEPAIRSIKGVNDLLPDEMARWHVIENTARRLSHLYGFREIRVPIFEMTELFARSIGASTDIVEKEMYTFQDRDGSSVTLRPEGTAGVVRAYIEHHLAGSGGIEKFYYLGPMFRHERQQKGRFRQFHQYGVESFGSADPLADVEVIALLWRFLTDLHLPALELEINSLGDPTDRGRYKTVLLDFLKKRKDELCENCRRRMDTNPLRVLDCKVPSCRTVTADGPKLIDYLSDSSLHHFKTVLNGLKTLGIPSTLNSRLVRGLDYYTLTTFEVISTSEQLGVQQNAVGAGGRYDGLVETLGGPKVPAVGFAVGLERVALLLPDSVLPSPAPTIYVAGFGLQGASAGFRLLEDLRAAGVPAERDPKAATLKAHLKQADRLGASHAVIIGDDEATKGRCIVRNMTTKEQEELPLDSAAQALADKLSRT